MLDSILIFLAKELIGYFFSSLAKRAGHTEAATHMLNTIENAKPLPADPLPSPAAQRKPKQYTDS